MGPIEIQRLCEREVDFPITHDALIDELGEAELRPPTGEPTTVGTVLKTTNERSYESVDDVYQTILGNLDESFVGRKFYDDRGGVWDFDHRDRTYSF
ncbi:MULTISPECIES: hypothetical protein [Halobacteriales]|uniref:Uncharacterized protein n=2 Tax=Halobacteriales TaxID=2235 RepID=A0ABD5SRP4_9EURY|nr:MULTISPECIES: hypothetical protein [Halobacteria]